MAEIATEMDIYRHDKLVPLLIESVKELEQDNNELKARIATLESNTP